MKTCVHCHRTNAPHSHLCRECTVKIERQIELFERILDADVLTQKLYQLWSVLTSTSPCNPPDSPTSLLKDIATSLSYWILVTVKDKIPDSSRHRPVHHIAGTVIFRNNDNYPFTDDCA